ncbi:uncharacterized protein LOC130137861 [Syzygium oleosum]|uniref:uncharacterized protein LOC130137861 n=1 Tax=Syzygium oleosum TaxID=219896 RepID=UPI0024B97B4D|nr:uncharacterized protein LOC130137861 [Syzygium oleosum]
MSVTAEIFVITGSGPATSTPHEARLLLTRRSYFTTLVIRSRVSSAVPSSFASNPLVAVAQIADYSGPPMRDSDPLNQQAYLENRTAGGELRRVLCAVVDLRVWWTKEVFWKFRARMLIELLSWDFRV